MYTERNSRNKPMEHAVAVGQCYLGISEKQSPAGKERVRERGDKKWTDERELLVRKQKFRIPVTSPPTREERQHFLKRKGVLHYTSIDNMKTSILALLVVAGVAVAQNGYGKKFCR